MFVNYFDYQLPCIIINNNQLAWPEKNECLKNQQPAHAKDCCLPDPLSLFAPRRSQFRVDLRIGVSTWKYSHLVQLFEKVSTVSNFFEKCRNVQQISVSFAPVWTFSIFHTSHWLVLTWEASGPTRSRSSSTSTRPPSPPAAAEQKSLL